MRAKNLFLCMGTAIFLLAGCEEYTSGEEIIQSVAPAIWDPGETWNAPSTFGLDTDLWPATQYARAAGIITIPGTGSVRGWCSASIIGTNRIATAEHCLANTSVLSNIGFTPSIFTEFSNVPLGVRSDVASARRGLVSLGFRGTALDDAIDTVRELMPLSLSRGEWSCQIDGADGTRDAIYLTCGMKLLTLENGSTILAGVGDVYGWMDPQVRTHTNGDLTYALTSNRRYSTSGVQVLLSPHGVIQNSAPPSCNLTGFSYTGCIRTQRSDTLQGSSGGALLSATDHRFIGTFSGMTSTTRTPQCWGSPSCASNFDVFAMVTSNVFNDQHFNVLSSLGSVPNVALTTRFAASSGTLYDGRCRNDEAMVGINGSAISPFLSSQRYIGAFGGICSPVHFAWPVRANGATYVQTGGSADTESYATPAYTSSNRVTLNRYRNTQPSGTWAFILPALLPTREFLCPPPSAVYKIVAEIEGGAVVGIQSIGCRYPNGATVELDIPDSSLGRATGTPTIETRSCAANRIAIGHRQWVGTRVEDLQLSCRDW